METAATTLDFEQAALCRDQIADLRQIQQRQHVEGESGDLDVMACAVRAGRPACRFSCFVAGACSATRPFSPVCPREEAGAVLSAFLAQYYLDKDRSGRSMVSPNRRR
jgi:excinuclease ABC subunit C